MYFFFIHSSVDEHLGCFHENVVYTHTRAHTHTRKDIHTMDYYSAIYKNEILLFATTWMDLEKKPVIAKQKGMGVRWTGSLGLVDANYYIQNG